MFLFQDVLVITRSVSFNDQPVSYQLCRQPIPIRQLDLEDLLDGEMRVGGSIRGAFSNTERSQCISNNTNNKDDLSYINELELNPSHADTVSKADMFRNIHCLEWKDGTVLHSQRAWAELELQLSIYLKDNPKSTSNLIYFSK